MVVGWRSANSITSRRCILFDRFLPLRPKLLSCRKRIGARRFISFEHLDHHGLAVLATNNRLATAVCGVAGSAIRRGAIAIRIDRASVRRVRNYRRVTNDAHIIAVLTANDLKLVEAAFDGLDRRATKRDFLRASRAANRRGGRRDLYGVGVQRYR